MTTQGSHLEAVRSMGVIAGQAKRHISGLWGTLQQAKSRVVAGLLSKDDLRQIIAEQLPRVNVEQQELALQEHERRLKAMAEELYALQAKIQALPSGGHSNARILPIPRNGPDDVNALPGADDFSTDERNILATILKQNIALQEPQPRKSHVKKESLVGQAAG
ncbi:MAG: hypothetical protein HQL20_09815 [Candidatus Omnitrophica bacterium]|nr:hypothetical protein [Candidatus Omnitrophota bacterium]